MDTDPVDKQLLAHAERQTKALENINWVVMALFVAVLVVAAVWVIAALS